MVRRYIYGEPWTRKLVQIQHGRATVIESGIFRDRKSDPSRGYPSTGTLHPQEVIKMSDTTLGSEIAAPIPVGEVLPWLIFGVLMLLAIYIVGTEECATSIINGKYVHEWVHDGRHLLGFPCH